MAKEYVGDGTYTNPFQTRLMYSKVNADTGKKEFFEVSGGGGNGGNNTQADYPVEFISDPKQADGNLKKIFVLI